jgi:hypothetical protein
MEYPGASFYYFGKPTIECQTSACEAFYVAFSGRAEDRMKLVDTRIRRT